MKKIPDPRFVLWIAIGCVTAGFAIVVNPVVALIFAAGVIFAALLELGPGLLVGMAVAFACTSRVLSMVGVPRLVNFLHFVLVAEAFAVALMRRNGASRFTRNIARFVAGLFAVCFLSWALNGGEIARPLMLGLVLSEPFLALFALVQARPNANTALRLWVLLTGIVIIQIPVALFQFAVVAQGPDDVRGTFIGQGAGAHVLGGICLVAVLFCFAKILTSCGGDRNWAIAGAVALSIVPLLADAKQVIVCFVPAILYLLGELRRGSLAKLVIPSCTVAILFACAYAVYEPLQKLSDTSSLEQGIQGKLAGLKVLTRYMNRQTGGWLLGVGPGNSVSRIALMPVEEPLQILPLKVSQATVDMLAVSNSNYLWSSSSVWSSISSWVGLVGDIGPLGLAVYVSGILLIWRELKRSDSWQSSAARASLVMAGGLGLFYSWLEEPAFMLMIFVAAGLSINGPSASAVMPNPRARPAGMALVA